MMTDELILNFVVIFILLEVYEILWQKSETLMGMMVHMYHYYSKSIFLFLIMHPTFYFSIGFLMLSNYSTYAAILLFIKTVDIVIKIVLIEQIFIKRELSKDLALALIAPINSFVPYMGLLIYIPLVIFSIK